MRAPFSGWEAAYSWRIDIRPGISASARRISLRPHSARLISFTLYFRLKSMFVFVNVLILFDFFLSLLTVGYNALFDTANYYEQRPTKVRKQEIVLEESKTLGNMS